MVGIRPTMRKRKPKYWLNFITKDLVIDILIGLFVLGLVTAGSLTVWISTLKIPDLNSFDQRQVLQSTKIYDRTGQVLLYDLHQDVRRTVVPSDQISPYLKDATIAIEDQNFYHHGGIDVKAIIRAGLSDILTGHAAQGGSTITQQVVKNTILVGDKSITRKIKEAILAIKMERVYSKDQILTTYLNEAPYGGTLYGVEEAAQAYFGKAANDVDIAQAAYLAALPQSPTYLSPYGNHRAALDARQHKVLENMLSLNMITKTEYDTAVAEKVTFQPQSLTGIKAPHFVMYVRDQLIQKYGEDVVNKGYKVITSLDWDLQQAAEQAVAKYAAVNQKKFNADNAGMVAVQPQTGDILVMVGSRNYFDKQINGNFNVTLAPRQPGSSIKPIVYASAFTKGYTPDTIVYDVPTQFSTACAVDNFTMTKPCYAPINWDHKFDGPMTLRDALAQSRNIPAIKVLYLTSIPDTVKLATAMGITTLNDPSRLGLTLVLGGGEVTLLQHTGAYAVFANEGVKADERSILRIEDANGNTIEQTPVHTSRVLDRNVALEISNVLSDDNARAPLWGHHSLVYFPGRDVAIKSGTTDDLRDAWLMGYTPNLAVGVWAGNNDDTPMNSSVHGLIATPMWSDFMNYALSKIPDEKFPQPAPIDPTIKPILRGQAIDSSSLIDSVQSGSSTLNLSTVANNMHSILYYVDRNNPLGPAPTNPAADPQYKYWEYGVQRWKQEKYGLLLSNQNLNTGSTTTTQ